MNTISHQGLLLDESDELIATHSGLPFLPEGGIAETYISNTLPDEALITSVFGFVFSKDQVLFTRGEADHAHTLEIPGGHKESGENTTETVLREIQEETSIVPEKYVYVGYVKITVPENTVEYAYPVPTSYMALYVLTVESEAETNELGVWLSLEEARKNSWVVENRAVFEAMYQESKILRGLYEKSFLETYNVDGTPTRQIASYDRVHRQGLWHKGVHVWLLTSDNKFLVQKRGPSVQTAPGKYECAAAGHIDVGHTSLETAIKELEEEAGIAVCRDDVELVGTIVDQFTMCEGTILNNEFDDVYLIRKNIIPEDLSHHGHEVSSFHFFDAEEYLSRGRHNDFELVMRRNEYELLYKHLFGN